MKLLVGIDTIYSKRHNTPAWDKQCYLDVLLLRHSADQKELPLQLQKQFLALAQLRAIETGRDLLSVGNTGPTALISANGSVERLLSPEAPGVAETDIQVRQRVTPYSRWISPPPRTISPS